jgi:hypothetical protein
MPYQQHDSSAPDWLLRHMLTQQNETQTMVASMFGEFRAFRDEVIWRLNRSEHREWARQGKPPAKPSRLAVLKEIPIRDLVWALCLVVLALSGQFLDVARSVVGLSH